LAIRGNRNHILSAVAPFKGIVARQREKLDPIKLGDQPSKLQLGNSPALDPPAVANVDLLLNAAVCADRGLPRVDLASGESGIIMGYKLEVTRDTIGSAV
jgi:hypothetical protein